MRESKRKQKQNEEFLSQHLSISHHSLAKALLIRLLFLILLFLRLLLSSSSTSSPSFAVSFSSHLMPLLIISHYSYSNRSLTSPTSSYSISSLNSIIPSSCTISSFKYSYFLFFSFPATSHLLVYLLLFFISLLPLQSPLLPSFLPPCHCRHIIYEVLRMFLSAVLLCNQGYQHVNQYQ